MAFANASPIPPPVAPTPFATSERRWLFRRATTSRWVTIAARRMTAVSGVQSASPEFSARSSKLWVSHGSDNAAAHLSPQAIADSAAPIDLQAPDVLRARFRMSAKRSRLPHYRSRRRAVPATADTAGLGRSPALVIRRGPRRRRPQSRNARKARMPAGRALSPDRELQSGRVQRRHLDCHGCAPACRGRSGRSAAYAGSCCR
jgi:hypothetical protein